jgi:hypothetical protein
MWKVKHLAGECTFPDKYQAYLRIRVRACNLSIGERYNIIGSENKLVYIGEKSEINWKGHKDTWYEFAKVESPQHVWVEVDREYLPTYIELTVP